MNEELSNLLHAELTRLLNDFGAKHDMPICQAIGVLEVVKADLIQELAEK